MRRPVAYNMLRDFPVYRRGAFDSGLAACGFRIERGRGATEIRRDDVLVIWNRYGEWHNEACKFEAAGAQVLVCENGYLGREWRDGIWYAISRNWHNTVQAYGGPERWDSLGIELAPWRESGEHILVLPNRGIGVPPVKQPDDWLQRVLAWLRKNTDRPVRVRQHPGTAEARPIDHGLLKDLRNAHCTVTWSSGAALKGLNSGVPCFSCFPEWIGGNHPLGDVEAPPMGDRLEMFRQIAWSIWSLPEIERGEPFKWLLSESTK